VSQRKQKATNTHHVGEMANAAKPAPANSMLSAASPTGRNGEMVAGSGHSATLLPVGPRTYMH